MGTGLKEVTTQLLGYVLHLCTACLTSAFTLSLTLVAFDSDLLLDFLSHLCTCATS